MTVRQLTKNIDIISTKMVHFCQQHKYALSANIISINQFIECIYSFLWINYPNLEPLCNWTRFLVYVCLISLNKNVLILIFLFKYHEALYQLTHTKGKLGLAAGTFIGNFLWFCSPLPCNAVLANDHPFRVMRY